MDLHWLGAQIASSPAGADGLAANIDPMLAKLDDAVQSVRRLARDLRPPALDPLGFVDAIRAEAAAFERRANVRCRVEVRHPNVAIDEARAASVFVIVREALTNALRHAAPTRITVALRGSAKWMTISVADNGRGIPDDRIRSHDSLGLTGMRERAAELGGSLDIRRRRSSGTCVALTIPLLAKQAPRR
jgi:signal transduction histidine kinase